MSSSRDRNLNISVEIRDQISNCCHFNHLCKLVQPDRNNRITKLEMIDASSHIKFTKKFSERVHPMDRNIFLDEKRLQNKDLCNQKLESKAKTNKRKKIKTHLIIQKKHIDTKSEHARHNDPRATSWPQLGKGDLGSIHRFCWSVSEFWVQKKEWFCDNHEVRNAYLWDPNPEESEEIKVLVKWEVVGKNLLRLNAEFMD